MFKSLQKVYSKYDFEKLQQVYSIFDLDDQKYNLKYAIRQQCTYCGKMSSKELRIQIPQNIQNNNEVCILCDQHYLEMNKSNQNKLGKICIQSTQGLENINNINFNGVQFQMIEMQKNIEYKNQIINQLNKLQQFLKVKAKLFISIRARNIAISLELICKLAFILNQQQIDVSNQVIFSNFINAMHNFEFNSSISKFILQQKQETKNDIMIHDLLSILKQDENQKIRIDLARINSFFNDESEFKQYQQQDQDSNKSQYEQSSQEINQNQYNEYSEEDSELIF